MSKRSFRKNTAEAILPATAELQYDLTAGVSEPGTHSLELVFDLPLALINVSVLDGTSAIRGLCCRQQQRQHHRSTTEPKDMTWVPRYFSQNAGRRVHQLIAPNSTVKLVPRMSSRNQHRL